MFRCLIECANISRTFQEINKDLLPKWRNLASLYYKLEVWSSGAITAQPVATMEYGMRLPMVGGGGGEKKHRMPVIPGVGIAGLENMTKPKHGTQVVNDGVLVWCWKVVCLCVRVKIWLVKGVCAMWLFCVGKNSFMHFTSISLFCHTKNVDQPNSLWSGTLCCFWNKYTETEILVMQLITVCSSISVWHWVLRSLEL